MRIVRDGITRTVLLTRHWAVKVPSLRGGSSRGKWSRARFFAHGWIANLDELEWHGYHNREELKVVPVIHSFLGGLVQVYPRAEAFYAVEEDPHEYGLDMAPVLFPGRHESHEGGDLKHDNLGWLTDSSGTRRVVWLDYAVNPT